jgi:Bacterial Ig domain/Secretion system C-terminal sorting domain/SdrD B-like domain
MATGAAINGIDKTGTPFANAGILSFDISGNYTFDPVATFTGIASVPYRISDNGNLMKVDTAYLTITVDPLPTTGINTVIANNDENISYGNAVSNSLFLNDKDPQNDLFTVTVVTGGTPGSSFTVAGTNLNGNAVANAGTLIINTNGSYTYTPGGFIGSINVPYTITDALGAASTATLNIDVLSSPNGILNDPPFAGDDFSYTTINKSVNGNFINNDSDPNGNPVSFAGITIVPGGAHTAIGSALPTIVGGTVQFYADGTYTYTPPAGYIGPDAVNYTICDVTAVTPQPLCANAQIQLLVGPGISITGKVWDDANGNVIDPGAGEPETNIGGTLFVNLANGAGNIVGTVAVANDGTYNFNNVTPGTDYTLMLSTIQGTVGQPAPATVLPVAWTNTGETRNGTIDLGAAGIIDTRTYGFTNAINFDFGIEQLPNSFDVTQSVSQPLVGQLITLNGGVNPPIPTGSDPEDGALGAGNTIVITALPANSTLLYNGIAVTTGQVIPNFNPALLQIEFTPATVGAINTSFQFAYLDAAVKQDPTPATYSINWLLPLPIKLESFTAAPQNNTVVLRWVISDEVNVSQYEIEFSSTATNFISIGNITANGNRNYSMLHTKPVIGFNYYRLKTTDKDGNVSYSDVRKVNFGKGGTVSVYPNPAVSFVNITLTNAMVNKPGTISLLSAEGKVVFQKHTNALSQTETITVANFAGGKYIVQIFTDKEVVTKSLEIIR